MEVDPRPCPACNGDPIVPELLWVNADKGFLTVFTCPTCGQKWCPVVGGGMVSVIVNP